ncbi:hypothetical protein LTS14_002555 [Recurvomyces mirabilis]|uniref:uncharacterized protein n=1 Tax=Recurvomyces mirabilis TaxID=574656 RepID=UPI002DE0C821|nr:hypothetical protein LTS14_002555 [Recurvomyces mirabilis]
MLNATQTSTSSSPIGYGPYSAPVPAVSSPSSSVAGAIGATGSGYMPAPTGNGTITSPSTAPVPYTGSATTEIVDHELMLCFIISMMAAIMML